MVKRGCGVVLAIFGVIILVGFMIGGLGEPETQRQPIPDNVPPAAATPAPKTGVQQWAEHADFGIPVPALMAYGEAETWAQENLPGCKLAWNTLAGVGYVETKHGTYREGAIIGPQLNGDGFAEVKDTDNGELDGDNEYDRAVGPMQFIPETWRAYGEGSPHDIAAAAKAAARLLCSHDRDLSTPEGWTDAIHAYNYSNEYVRNVRDAAANYALGQRPE